MGKATAALRKILVLAIGIPLLIIGIILIPLPGPGILVCAAALFILSLEFEWADRYFQRIKQKLQELMEAAKQKADPPDQPK